MGRARHRLLVEGHLDPVDAGQPLAVAPGHRTPGRDLRVQALDPAQPERSVGLVHPVVEADVGDVVAEPVALVALPGDRAHRVRAQRAGLGELLLILGDDRAPLADRELLLGEEAEAADLTHRPDRLGVRPGGGADRLGAVLDQHDAALVADLAQHLDRGRVSPEVDRDHRLGPRADQRPHLLGVEVGIERRDRVGEDDVAAAMLDHVGVGDEAEGGDDDLVTRADAGDPTGEMKGSGTAADRDRLLGAGNSRDLALEALRPRPHRQPAGAQALEDRGDVLVGDLDLDQGDVPAHARTSPSASTTWTTCSSLMWGKSGRLNWVAEARSVRGSETSG